MTRLRPFSAFCRVRGLADAEAQSVPITKQFLLSPDIHSPLPTLLAVYMALDGTRAATLRIGPDFVSRLVQFCTM